MNRHVPSLLRLAAPILLITSLAAAQAPDPTAMAEPAADVEAKGPPEVELLEQGQEPRRELRLNLSNLQDETMVMDIDMSSHIEAGPQVMDIDLPTMQMVMDIDQKKVTQEGNLSYHFTLREAKVMPGEGANPQMVAAMRQGLTSVQGVSGSGVVTPRGETLEASIEVPEGAPPQVKQQLDQMKGSLQQMSASLPEEPVGVGASWRVKMTMPGTAFEIEQTATYTIERFDGDAVVLNVEFKQEAPEQLMGPAGQQVKLTSLEGSGKGTIVLDSSRMVPRRSEVTVDMSMEMVPQGAGAPAGMVVKTEAHVEMKMRPGEAGDAAGAAEEAVEPAGGADGGGMMEDVE